MGKDKFSAFMANLAMLLALESYSPGKIDKDMEIKEECVETKIDDLELDGQEVNIDIPDESGSVSNLPWVNDQKFLEAQEKNNAYILMAAYCSVLIDPLPGEEFNVSLAAKALVGTVVPSEDIFSQNKALGPYTESRGYRKGASYSGSNIVQTEGGGVCKIASTLYNVAILSNLDIIERHNHTMPVNYVPYGQDATVAYGGKDFKFKNNRDFPILIWSQIVGNRLYIGFYGQEASPEIKWNHKTIDMVEAPKYYRQNPDLKEGEERVILKGMDGATVESWITIKEDDGKIKTKNLGISRYIPMPHIIEVNELK